MYFTKSNNNIVSCFKKKKSNINLKNYLNSKMINITSAKCENIIGIKHLESVVGKDLCEYKYRDTDYKINLIKLIWPFEW